MSLLKRIICFLTGYKKPTPQQCFARYCEENPSAPECRMYEV